jgi:hypothetical protein
LRAQQHARNCLMDGIQIETTVVHAPLTRRSVVTIVLQGGDLGEREAIAQAITAQVAERPPPAPETTAPALSSVFAILSRPTPLTEPKLLPNRITGPDYDEPFILAPIERQRL